VGQRTVVVIAGGERAPAVAPSLPAGAVVVAADSGVDFALALGLSVDVAIGDFDSVSPAGLERVRNSGARIDAHPAAKDMTDLELAMDEALRMGATDIVALGVGGGRLDHLLANLLVLASPRFAACRITAYAGPARAHVVHEGASVSLEGVLGEVVTLVPVGGPAQGITTGGLEFPLCGEGLAPGTSRGVSNVVVASPITVGLDGGTLLVVFPGEEN
jgi:thiamine pyrophosphokinase